MRLERLEISGFKSFSDRAELAFDEGVTAIVGPNGCGKSNVADAITWVLGEQSAKSLRGDKMEDVIFSGSDARKPGGAAEVRLRLSGLPLPPKPVPDTPAHAAATEPFRLDAPESVPGHDGQRPRATATATATPTATATHRAGSGARRDAAGARQPDAGRRGARGLRAHLHARRRGDAAAVPLGRQRIPDRRRSVSGCATSTSCSWTPASAPRRTRSSSRARSA